MFCVRPLLIYLFACYLVSFLCRTRVSLVRPSLPRGPRAKVAKPKALCPRQPPCLLWNRGKRQVSETDNCYFCIYAATAEALAWRFHANECTKAIGNCSMINYNEVLFSNGCIVPLLRVLLRKDAKVLYIYGRNDDT